MVLVPFRLTQPCLPRILYHSEEAYNIFTNLKPLEEGLQLNFQAYFSVTLGRSLQCFAIVTDPPELVPNKSPSAWCLSYFFFYRSIISQFYFILFNIFIAVTLLNNGVLLSAL